MKKTLIICGKYPLPEDHGAPMRTMNVVRFFRKYGRVDVAYSGSSAGEVEGREVFSHAFHIKKREYPKSLSERVERILNLHNTPLPLDELDPASEKTLQNRIEGEDYDYIFVRHVMNSPILFKLPEKYRKRTIIDFDDILSGSLYDSMYGAVRGWHKRMIVALNRLLLTNYERKCLYFGASLFCSDDDRAWFAGKNGKAVMRVVPNIYVNNTFEDFDFGEGFDKENTLLFVGSLGYGPNERGLRWFIETIFPCFRERYADGRLLVVGRTPDDKMRQLCSGTEGVELHADVPDIRGYYQRCKAVIVPLLAGGGTRIKILEAAMAARPVLSTRIGAEGLALEGERDILLFEGAEDFVFQYARLDDVGRYSSLVGNAKKIVLSRYSVGTFNGIMEEILGEIDSRSVVRNDQNNS